MPRRWARRRRTPLVAFLLALLACGCAAERASEEAPPAPRSVGLPAGAGLREGSLDPPPGAVELCTGHLTGAPLPDGRPGPHVAWTLYTSGEARHLLAARYLETLGDAGHVMDGGCDSWRRPPERPDRILAVCELAAEGPWGSCPPPPETAKSRVLLSTMARSD